MKPIPALAAFAAMQLATPGALAQSAPLSPAGDWHGLRDDTRSAIHIEQTGPGTLAGDIDLPDAGQWDVPLDEVTFRDGTLSFSYRGGTRRFEGRWDAAARAWTGRLHAPNGSTEMTYKPGYLGLSAYPDLNGRWEGAVAGAGFKARVVLRVATNEHGTYGLLDLPDAMEVGVPIWSLVREGEKLEFAGPAGIAFKGIFDPAAGSFKGMFTAPGSLATPLELVRTDRAGPRRPQTPTPPLPYRTEQLTFANPAAPDVRLGCTLALPSRLGPHPVAMLLTGTGPQDRDESLAGHKPFLVLADHLARHGVASLRCDDRGVGASTGKFDAATLDDFVSDIEAGIALLRTRRDIALGKIGLIGHSEGALHASIAAAKRTDIAFVIQLAGPGVPIEELLLRQGEDATRAMGVPEPLIAQQSIVRREIFAAVRAAATPDAARAAAEAVLVSKGVPQEAAKGQAAMVARPDIVRIIGVDPAVPLARIPAPVLAITGSKDLQVAAAPNLAGMRSALARNPDATVRELTGLNHLLQTAETGALGEYYDIEETMAPLALGAITEWLAKRGFGRR